MAEKEKNKEEKESLIEDVKEKEIEKVEETMEKNRKRRGE